MLLNKLKENFNKSVIQNSNNVENVDKTYPSSFRNTIAFSLDFMLLGLIRASVIMLSSIVMNSYRTDFITKFETLFSSVKNFDITVGLHRKILFSTAFGKGMIVLVVICVIIGMIYNTYMLQTHWFASFGRRATNIYVAKKNGEKMTLLLSFIRTMLSYIPWFLPVLAYYTWFNYKYLSICIVLLSCFWSDTYLFTGKRIGIHDILTGTRSYIGYK